MVALIALAATLGAQAPQLVNYQAVIRDSLGKPVTDTSLSVRVRILQGASDGTVVFEEAHAGESAVNGLVQFAMGAANPGDFAGIDWSDGPYFVQIDYDLNNGTAFSNTDAVQILSVPYSMYAEKAGSSGDWESIGDSALTTPKKLGIGGYRQVPSEVMLQVLNPGQPTSLLIGDYANNIGKTYLGLSTTADENGDGIIQAVKTGSSAWGSLLLNPGGGPVGINNPNPVEALDVRGSIYLKNDWSAYRLVASNPTIGDIRWEMAPNGTSYFFNNNTNKYLLHFNSNGRIAVGHTIPQYDFDVNGSLGAHCVAITGGCDIIENTNSTETLYPGEVIVIDPARPNHVLRSNKAYDRMTIGVISGAGGVTHGMMLSQEGVLDGNVSFAIAGRVKVKVTGNVQPGDLLTTSDVPGHAMSAKNRRKRDGAVIGKALSAPDSEGLVLMLVMMQ